MTCWFKLKETHFKNNTAIFDKALNVLFGLGKSFSDNREFSWSNKTPNFRGTASSSDFGEPMMYYNYGFVNNNMMNPQFYGQNDPFFQNLPGSSYPFNFNMNMGPQFPPSYGQSMNGDLSQMLNLSNGMKLAKNQKQNFKENKLFMKNT